MSGNKPVDLTPLNSFGVRSTADAYTRLASRLQLRALIELRNHDTPYFFLGGGSNLLLIGHLPCHVIHVSLQGLRFHDETETSVSLTAQAGENWHTVVMTSLTKGYSGLENLALIPGTVGAAPIQNIGAYGVELKDRLIQVEALDYASGKTVVFSREDCQFGYRDSIFKKQLDRFLILSVTLKLDKQCHPVLGYQPLRDRFASLTEKQLEGLDIAQKVIETRQSKLPDPKHLGNAGSFFKNPVVNAKTYDHIRQTHPDVVGYQTDDCHYKLAAGWLIDRLGLKGYRQGDAGIHQDQALVLVNHGKASGEQILMLSQYVQKRVYEAYGINLEREVRVLDAGSFQ